MILNAYSVSTGLVLAQYPIEEKSCELNELPDILDLLDVRDCMVSIDAIATHIGLMVKIINSGGHFIFQVKANQKSAMEDIRLILTFGKPGQRRIVIGSSTEKSEAQTGSKIFNPWKIGQLDAFL